MFKSTTQKARRNKDALARRDRHRQQVFVGMFEDTMIQNGELYAANVRLRDRMNYAKVVAYEEAFNHFAAREGMIREYAQKIGEGLGHALGQKLRPHAERLMRAATKHPAHRAPMLTGRLEDRDGVANTKVVRMRGSIEPLRYELYLPA